MGNSVYTQYSHSLNKARLTLYAAVNIGTTGAPTLQQWSPTSAQIVGAYAAASTSPANAFSPGGAQGIASIVRNSAGNYTVTLQDTGQRILDVHATFLVPTTGIAASPNVGVIKPAGTGGSLGTSKNSVNVVFSTGGVATDPANGEQIILAICIDQSGAI